MLVYDNLRREYVSKAPLLDYMAPEVPRWKTRWRQAISRVIANKREQKKKVNLDMKEMLDRIKAIIACESAGNDELS
jgi:hypothetical protein